eukprot:scaffold207657_cov27-Tisochrysis_lutea.AAC.2
MCAGVEGGLWRMRLGRWHYDAADAERSVEMVAYRMALFTQHGISHLLLRRRDREHAAHRSRRAVGGLRGRHSGARNGQRDGLALCRWDRRRFDGRAGCGGWQCGGLFGSLQRDEGVILAALLDHLHPLGRASQNALVADRHCKTDGA